ncbi:MAG: Mce-associated rane protein [Frankiales bacterium]|jgi:Mce-associated membrane protein|nr:Mce-associated rane protein [Frankiales bacterium]
MAKPSSSSTQPPRRRRHVVAGQRRLAREHGANFSAPPVVESVTAPPAPPSHFDAPPLPRQAPAPGPDKPKRPRRQLSRLKRPTLSLPTSWRASPTVVAAALTAAVVVLATLAGLLFYKWEHGKAVASAKRDAVAAASVAMTNVLSYDYKTIDADIARAQRYLTGTFRTEYVATTEKTVKDAAVRNKATVKADVAYAGAIKASPNKATVLIFVDQTATNTALKAPRIDRNRIRLEMSKVNGKWLVAKLTPL